MELSRSTLSADLDKSVLSAEELIWRFKNLAARLDLSDTDDSHQAFEATESLIFSYRDIARRVAHHVREGSISPEEESVLLGLIAWATREIQRATLMLTRQIFRLDDTRGKGAESLSVS